MVKSAPILCFLLYLSLYSHAGKDTSFPSSSANKRLIFVSGANALFYAGSYITLNKAWYNDFEKEPFHFFNDNAEWNQVDKVGHVWSTYQFGRWSSRMWQWAGLTQQQAALAGAAGGMLYQGIIEIQDAYSAEWGFSWGDMGANLAGAAIFAVQELTWKDQRIQLKMGYHPFNYPPALKNRRNELFGTSVPERILKDYNSQTYWLTANVSSFLPESTIPKWLNISVGYGAGGMYGGRINVWTDDETGITYDYTHLPRIRRFYLSPDVDLTRLPVKSKLLKSVLFVVNSFRIPLPALELSNGKISGVVR